MARQDAIRWPPPQYLPNEKPRGSGPRGIVLHQNPALFLRLKLLQRPLEFFLHRPRREFDSLLLGPAAAASGPCRSPPDHPPSAAARTSAAPAPSPARWPSRTPEAPAGLPAARRPSSSRAARCPCRGSPCPPGSAPVPPPWDRP